MGAGSSVEAPLSVQEIAEQACAIFREQLHGEIYVLVRLPYFQTNIVTQYIGNVVHRIIHIDAEYEGDAEVYAAVQVIDVRAEVYEGKPVVKVTINVPYDDFFAVRRNPDEPLMVGLREEVDGKDGITFGQRNPVEQYIQGLPIAPNVVEVENLLKCFVKVEYSVLNS